MRRRRHNRCTLILILLLTFSPPTWAESITYKGVVKDALQNSARIRVKAEDIHISNAVYRQNYAGLYPEVAAVSRFEKHENLANQGAGIDTINGEVVGGDQSAWRSSAYLQGQYYLSHWYKKRFEIDYYERLRDVRICEVNVEAKSILKEITGIYGVLAENGVKLRYGADILRRMQEVLYLKKQAFVGGQAAYEEVLKLEADIVALEKEMGAIRKEYKENLEKLYSYTGKAYGEDVDIEALSATGEQPLPDYSRRVEETPEYRAKIKELEAVKAKSKAVSNNFFPDVSLYGRYDFYGANQDSLDRSVNDFRQTSYSAGVMISLPLFDGGVRKWDRARNLLEIKKQDETIKAVAEEKNRDIRTLYAGYQEILKSFVHYRKLADQYGRMLDITKKAKGLGERSLVEVKELEKDSLTVERDLKAAEQTLAAYERRIMIETDYKTFISEHNGNWPYQY